MTKTLYEDTISDFRVLQINRIFFRADPYLLGGRKLYQKFHSPFRIEIYVLAYIRVGAGTAAPILRIYTSAPDPSSFLRQQFGHRESDQRRLRYIPTFSYVLERNLLMPSKKSKLRNTQISFSDYDDCIY